MQEGPGSQVIGCEGGIAFTPVSDLRHSSPPSSELGCPDSLMVALEASGHSVACDANKRICPPAALLLEGQLCPDVLQRSRSEP